MRKWIALVIALTVSGAVVGQEGVSPLGIVPEPVPGFTVSIWPERPQYQIGETARIYFYVSRPAYVYIFDFEPAGNVRQIFPNAYSPNPYVSAGTHVLPDRPTYQLSVRPPAGTDCLQIIASLVPLGFGNGTTADPYPLLGPTLDQGKAHILGLVPEPGCGCYVTAWTTIVILAGPSYGYWPCPPCWGVAPCPPCFGYAPVSPGAGWFCDSAGNWHFFIGDCPPGPGWCWYLGPDGQWQVKFQIRLHFGD